MRYYLPKSLIKRLKMNRSYNWRYYYPFAFFILQINFWHKIKFAYIFPEISAEKISNPDSLKGICISDYSRFCCRIKRMRARILLKSSLNFYLYNDIRKFVGVLRQRRSRNFIAVHYNFDDIPNSLSTAVCEKKSV